MLRRSLWVSVDPCGGLESVSIRVANYFDDRDKSRQYDGSVKNGTVCSLVLEGQVGREVLLGQLDENLRPAGINVHRFRFGIVVLNDRED